MNSVDQTTGISDKMAQSVMDRYSPDQMQWHYEHGLVLQSIYEVGIQLRKSGYLSWVRAMYDSKITPDGTINSYKNDEFNLDQINPGKTLFDLYKTSGDEKYRIAIETLRAQLKNHPRTESNGFWHKKIYPWQMWLDGLYMQAPFYARYAAEFGTHEDFLDVISQLVLVESKTRDGQTGLLYHAWDESRKQLWADKTTGCSPHFWGRAMGWYCMAIVDVLDFVPETERYGSHRESLITIGQRLVQAVLKYQDSKSSLWYQVLDQGMREKNYLETSASSMFVYFLLKMIRKGYLDAKEIPAARKAARDAYSSLVNNRLTEDSSGHLHLEGICSVAGLGGNPYRDGSFDYYVKEAIVQDDFKGVGPFILASLEAERA